MTRTNAKGDSSGSPNKSADEVELEEEEPRDEGEASSEDFDGDEADADNGNHLDTRIVLPPTFDVEPWLHFPIGGPAELAYQLGRLVNAIDCCSLLDHYLMDEQANRNALLLADLIAGLGRRHLPSPLASELQHAARKVRANAALFNSDSHIDDLESHWDVDDGDPNPNTPSSTIALQVNYSEFDQLLQQHLTGTEVVALYRLGKIVDAGVRPLQSEWANKHFFKSDPGRWANARPDETWFGEVINAWSVCIDLAEPPPVIGQERTPSHIVPEIDAVVRRRFRETTCGSDTVLGLSNSAPVDQSVSVAPVESVQLNVDDESFDGFHPSDAKPPDHFWRDSVSGTQKQVFNWVRNDTDADSRGLRSFAKENPTFIWIRKKTSRTIEVFFRDEDEYRRVVKRRDDARAKLKDKRPHQ